MLFRHNRNTFGDCPHSSSLKIGGIFLLAIQIMQPLLYLHKIRLVNLSHPGVQPRDTKSTHLRQNRHLTSILKTYEAYQLPSWGWDVSGTPRNPNLLNFFNTKTGHENILFFPLISTPIFSPNPHQKISPSRIFGILLDSYNSRFTTIHSSKHFPSLLLMLSFLSTHNSPIF